MVLDDITENLFIYFVDGYFIVNVEPTRIGDWILNIKAYDSVGNCNESSFGYYAYQETENEEKPKISILPSNRTENISKDENKTEYENKTENKNETLKEQIVIYTHRNLITTLNVSKTVLENISTTIYAIPSEKGIKFEANSKTLKNFEFYVNGTKIKTNEEGYIIDEKNKEVFWDSLKENYERSLNEMEKSKILSQEGYTIGKVNSSKELQIIDGILVDLEGNPVKEDITIELENGENILIKGGIIDKESIKIIEKAEKDTKEKTYKEDNKETERITNPNFENIEEGKIFETEIRDSNGNLIKDKEVEIVLPNGEKIKVRTDKDGKVKLMQKDRKIEQVNAISIKIPYIEENKSYDIDVRDENGNLIKNSNVSVLLPNGQMLNVLTDENGKVKLQYKDG
ncbi:MAG: Ig-like domain-containing protein, partial [Candidatus Altarchaeum sp.]|nr:Ig-like domain-containing protein [Candidatus Altarchaeum sp.]